VIELAGNAALTRDLAAGGVFVAGCTLALAEECELVVCGANHRLSLPARVVYIDEQRGAGLELIGFSTAMRAQLAELAPIAPEPTDRTTDTTTDATTDDDLALPTLCNVELSGGDDPDPAPEHGDDSASAVPEPHDRDDEYRTLPVPAGAPEPEPDDDLAVPIEDDDDQHTAPVWTSSRARLLGEVDRGRAPSAPGIAAQRTSDLGQSDPAFAIGGSEADAAFFDAAEAGAADVNAANLNADLNAAANLGHSDPAFAIGGSEADAAFFDAAEAGTADVNAAEINAAEINAAAINAAEINAAEINAAEINAAEINAAAPADRPATAGAGAPPPMPGATDPGSEAVADQPEAGPEDDPGDELGHAADSPAARAPRHVHERLRGLTLVAQLKLAASGELHERIVLERLYGKNVWETLLRNPRLTPPEVSRIARYGSLPRVLLEIILGNATWLQVPEVRRALLVNPRLGTDQILKVLRLTPKHELRLAAIQTAYPQAVRQAAKLLLRGE
jgi:hypothetical protein